MKAEEAESESEEEREYPTSELLALATSPLAPRPVPANKPANRRDKKPGQSQKWQK